MKIELWFDFVCPYCFLGKKNLELALEKFAHKDEVTIDYRSYQLRPDAEKNTGINIIENLMKKYNITKDEAIKNCESVAERLRSVGLDYKYENQTATNTFDTFMVYHVAKENNLSSKYIDKIMNAYFIEGNDIGDIEYLLKVSEELGLDKNRVLEAINTREFEDVCEKEKQTAKNKGLSVVPFFLINDEFIISGSNSPEIILNTLRDIYKK